ncbi:MAG: hypothetical protein UZ01_00494 [Candidatus Brocadia sinica]|uniref:Pyruvate:ferredoxin oxidoreductase and related 2-oxoacid:ferredoxin oxidoreductases gamma subunit n=1 Tax=Candidatus Brocadia sinica JPN1 TaxID=1197129 RepID=A0ABQ0JWV8_9BACT|nr:MULTISPECIES: ferredoxin [Brocadia]KXK32524.1 MAG: hypothetical protein UZ01_00494 [Candidatus Brocadia sinica]NOG40997.1 ferredoxin [Planctomycetota bacterium]MCK6466600.1 ferredoxin [Candidatus Brocadia sinica]NUO06644.1 ferredoxin [Candidatus Brocadia sinica]GAN33190.1 pyruvate:ferredoxin oxidoreductase and related 2-oxoacid:ferredoxin oxidoreductases gamma subunit [Candidatus Brocadia sinica JPN1]
MKMKTVWFEGDCIKCSMCVEEASGAFDFVKELGPQVKSGVDVALHAEDIKRAADICPTQCIKYHVLLS